MKSEAARLIDQVISLGFSKALKRDGYTRKGRTWRFADTGTVQVVNVQGSTGNISYHGAFTINLGIYLPTVEIISIRSHILQAPNEAECTLRERIGSLLPACKDKWWEVDGWSSDLQAITDEIVEAWTLYGKPWIMRCSDPREARKYAAQKGNFWLATEISVALGEMEQAQRWLDETLRKYPYRNHALWLEWAAKHGLYPRNIQ